MIKLVRKYLIGGESGSREMVVLGWLAFAAAFRFAMLKEADGADMPGTFGLLTVIGAALVAWTGGAFGLDRLSRNGYFDGKAQSGDDGRE